MNQNFSVILNKPVMRLGILIGTGIILLGFFGILAKQSDAARENFYVLQKELELYRSGIWRLEKLNPEELSAQLEKARARFGSSANLAVLIGEITEWANRHHLAIASIAPGQKTEITGEKNESVSILDRIPIDIRLKGSYENLAAFLAQLGLFHHGAIKVDRFRLGPEGIDPSHLALALSASVYVAKNDKQDVLRDKIVQTGLVPRLAARSRFEAIKRNPFEKAAEAEIPVLPGKKKINLEGIIYDPAKPIVLINGETKSTGDYVEGMRIIEIQPGSVVFDQEGEKIIIQLRN